MTNFLALNKTNHRTILMQFWGSPKTLGGAHHVGTFEGFHWELWQQQQLPKSWYIHQWKQIWEQHGCLIMVHVVQTWP